MVAGRILARTGFAFMGGVLAAIAFVLFASTSPSLAAKAPSKPTAIVSLGDSFISGEAGRWQGNSLSLVGGRDGTDRAWTGSGYDPTKIYGDSGACHRSDSAEIQVPEIAVDRRINLACSGAVTENIFRSSTGGVGQNGEPAQADSLRGVAASNRVRAIVLSISGNDLGFADIITSCALAYIARAGGPCNEEQQDSVDTLMPAARAGTVKAIAEIRAVMQDAGYKREQYQLILQSYPSPVPRSSEARYGQVGLSRVSNGCPFFNADMDWARDSLVEQIGAMLRGVASEQQVRYLDLTDALQGREPCGEDAVLVTAERPPDGRTSEWARFLTGNLIQGEIQETLHPNYYGQRALAECFYLAYSAGKGDGRCLNRAGEGPAAMRYVQQPPAKSTLPPAKSCANEVRGTNRNDRLKGTGRNDRIRGGRGNDRINAGNGNDCVGGEEGNDRIKGGRGNDKLKGGPGRDRIFGGPGNDRIVVPEGGRDRVNCGPGEDVVILKRSRDRASKNCEKVRRK